ncbi:NAD(P)/FAD-dependent oxidoreductase [Brevibacterium atlanticum]|uniref:NAD(P)/FAD-dependent oxidoreductase n=1 Tax=Brevibacterium atlanticum TaxID=2697563 RepID=UPI0014248FAF|nr:NAD(P)/FAD-dependent oxidoreductase [Brevibacterium atlanticum]
MSPTTPTVPTSPNAPASPIDTESPTDTEAQITTDTHSPATDTRTVEVAIVGGGVAGLAASVALARSLRSVIVIDAGQPRNAPSAHAHNVLGNEGIDPLELVAKGRAEAEGYGVAFLDATVTHASPTQAPEEGPGHRFELATSAGVVIRAQRIIIAAGLTDELPDIPGLAEGWGDTVLHCPYCHGYEVRGQRLGIIGTTAMSYHQAMLFSQLSEDVTLIRHNAPGPDADQARMLDSLGIEYIDAHVAEVDRTDAGTVLSLRRRSADAAAGAGGAGGTETLTFDALAVGGYARANTELFGQLGGGVDDHPSGMGTYIPTQMAGQTAVPGVWAIGNSADMSAMVVASAASGVLAGAHVNADLIMSSVG